MHWLVKYWKEQISDKNYNMDEHWNRKVKEASHKRPDMYTVLLHLHVMSRKGKSIETESRLVVTRDWDSRECGMTTNEYTFFLKW